MALGMVMGTGVIAEWAPSPSSSSARITQPDLDEGETDAGDEEGIKARVGVMALIFFISLFGKPTPPRA